MGVFITFGCMDEADTYQNSFAYTESISNADRKKEAVSVSEYLSGEICKSVWYEVK